MKLLDLQQAMRAGIVGAAPDALAQAVMADGLSHERRIQIYRNHYYVTLIEALAATFPVTHRLVGERFFSAVARRFAAASPPAGPCLF
ncbi:MAG: DNA-binding domain-containing protein, partial [Alphaproteobacteria bacterium]